MAPRSSHQAAALAAGVATVIAAGCQWIGGFEEIELATGEAGTGPNGEGGPGAEGGNSGGEGGVLNPEGGTSPEAALGGKPCQSGGYCIPSGAVDNDRKNFCHNGVIDQSCGTSGNPCCPGDISGHGGAPDFCIENNTRCVAGKCAPCGADGQDCCDPLGGEGIGFCDNGCCDQGAKKCVANNAYCQNGNRCDRDRGCGTSQCGSNNDPCCAGNVCGSPDLICSGGMCIRCRAGKACCTVNGQSFCEDGSLCKNNVCTPCGRDGNTCCPGGVCYTSSCDPSTNVCHTGATCGGNCGGTSQACCSGGSCSKGSCCGGSTCVAEGQLCPSGYNCFNGSCACGQTGGQCCPGNSCQSGCCVSGTCVGEGAQCGTGASCSGGSCVACGGTGQPCCGGSCTNGGCCDYLASSGGQCVADQDACNSVAGARVCVGGACQTCGASTQVCCAGAACDQGGCDAGTCP